MNESRDFLSRPNLQQLDDLLGHRFPVLDDGFVRLIDYMGSDASIVQAARVSYGLGTKQLSEDRALIRYLMRHRHTTPFEMCELKIHVRVPMDTWRQWIRHRTASVNEYSTRYSVAIDATHKTLPDEWRLQSADNRQGSCGFVPEADGQELSMRESTLHEEVRRVYEDRLGRGVAREQARKDLVLSTYTEAFWKIDLHNLLHFLELRLDENAQHEIRSYARVLGEKIVANWCPLAWEAFLDYRVNGCSLSRMEVELINCLCQGNIQGAMEVAHRAGWVESGPEDLKSNRERTEVENRLQRLNLLVPWRKDA